MNQKPIEIYPEENRFWEECAISFMTSGKTGSGNAYVAFDMADSMVLERRKRLTGEPVSEEVLKSVEEKFRQKASQVPDLPF